MSPFWIVLGFVYSDWLFSELNVQTPLFAEKDLKDCKKGFFV